MPTYMHFCICNSDFLVVAAAVVTVPFFLALQVLGIKRLLKFVRKVVHVGTGITGACFLAQ